MTQVRISNFPCLPPQRGRRGFRIWPTATAIVALTLGVLAFGLVVQAQQPPLRVIGYLTTGGSPGPYAAFLQGLGETGYREGQNVVIERRSAEGQYERLPALAAELVSRQVAVIVTGGGNAPGLAVKAATSTIPIVFLSGGDPIRARREPQPTGR